MKLNNKIGIVLISMMLSLLFTLVVYPPSDDFHYANPSWNGYSKIYEYFNARRVGVDIDIREIMENPNRYALIIVPMKKPDEAYLNFIKIFLENGGLILVLDDHGYGNEILKFLNLKASFIHEGVVYDPVFFYKRPELAKVSFNLEGEDFILQLNYASMLQPEGCKVIASTSRFAFFDRNLNGLWEFGEDEGPLAVAAKCNVGAGEIVLISDPDVFSNFSVDNSDALPFLELILDGRELVIEEKLYVLGAYSEFRRLFLNFIYFLSLHVEYYIILISFIFFFILLFISKRWRI